jgi:hypothetical protein
VFDLETLKEEATCPLKGCKYKPKIGCDAERERENIYISLKCKKFAKNLKASSVF